MLDEWTIGNDKAIFNFSSRYYSSYDEILDSEAFRSLIEHFLSEQEENGSISMRQLIQKYFPEEDFHDRIQAMVRFSRLLCTINVREISQAVPRYQDAYEDRYALDSMVEMVYAYWRRQERYCCVFEDYSSSSGIGPKDFIKSKNNFDDLCLSFYREIKKNVSLQETHIYRQVKAGTNAGLVCKKYYWAVPDGYEKLKGIPFIKSLVLETPYITYPSRNRRNGYFKEVKENPINRISIDADDFFCYPALVGDLLAFIFVHRDFMTHCVSLANLFELASEKQAAGHCPDLIYIMGGDNHLEEGEDIFHYDEKNDIMLGFVSHHAQYDYFGYMKKMALTLHNVRQIMKGRLPIHGSMVQAVLKSGRTANICIMGDSGAGKSESIEAFRNLAADYLSSLTVIFDDMGTFALDGDKKKVLAYGTETGAFVRLDDLDSGYAFKELDRSIFMDPDQVNARLISPVTNYEEIMKGYTPDLFLYATNYKRVGEGESPLHLFKDKEEAMPVFIAGQRMPKGTTTETGMTSTFFANPFGPMQREEETRALIDLYFDKLFESGVMVGELLTQLAIPGMAHKGPEEAAVYLFDMIKKMDEND